MSRAVDRDRRDREPPGCARPRSRGPLVYRHAASRYSTVHLAFDIFQGIGVAAAVGIRPFLPALAAGALAAGDVEIHFDHTDFSFLQSAPFLLAMAVCAIVLALLERRVGTGAARARDPPGSSWPRRRWRSARCSSRARCAAATTRSGRGSSAGSCARRSASRPRARCSRALAPGSARTPLLPLFAEGSALLIAVLSVLAPPVGVIALLAAAVAAVGRPPARGSEVRGSCGSSGEQEARPGRDRRAQAVDARAGDRLGPRPGAAPDPSRRACYVADCVAAFPSVTPVCAATITTGDGPRPPSDPEHELVPPRGGPLRRVRLELLGQPPVRRAALADRHRVPDERRASLEGRRDRLRVARRRGRSTPRARPT